MRCQGRRARDSSGDRRDRMGRRWSRDTAPVFPVAGETSSEIWDLAPARPRVLQLTFKLLLVDRLPLTIVELPSLPRPENNARPRRDIRRRASANAHTTFPRVLARPHPPSSQGSSRRHAISALRCFFSSFGRAAALRTAAIPSVVAAPGKSADQEGLGAKRAYSGEVALKLRPPAPEARFWSLARALTRFSRSRTRLLVTFMRLDSRLRQ